jgi:RNA polymerase sigma factor (sigma-70 family)
VNGLEDAGDAGPPDDPWVQMLYDERKHLIAKRAKHYAIEYRGFIEEQDLRQLGHVGLLKAAQRYDDARRNANWESYSLRYINGEMLRAIKTEAIQRRVKRAMRRTGEVLLAEYHDDFDLLRHAKDELARRLDALCDAMLDVGAIAGAEEGARTACLDEDVAEREEYVRVRDGLRKAVRSLPEDQQRLLVMVYVEEFFVIDAAEALGIDRKTAERRHDRALQYLRRVLEQLDITNPPPPRRGPWDGGDEPGGPPLDPRLVKSEERGRWGRR